MGERKPIKHNCQGCGTTDNIVAYSNKGYFYLCSECLGKLNDGEISFQQLEEARRIGKYLLNA